MIKKMLSASLLICSFAYAEGNNSGGDFSEMQNFFKKQGYNEAKKEYYAKGYKKATADMTKILKLYKVRLKAQEAGKYLARKAKVTYEVYKRRDPLTKNYYMHIVSPSIEEELTPETLAILPDWNDYAVLLPNRNLVKAAYEEMYSKADLSSTDSQMEFEDSNINNSFSLPEVGNLEEKITSIEAKPKPYKATKTKKVKDLLDSMNLEYSENPTFYHVFFENKTQEKAFCIRFTGGDEKCENIK